MSKRIVDVVVISDVHLGTYGCHAKELVSYLKSIAPKRLILNGDIIDAWQFSKSYWPKSHTKVLRAILKFVSEGVPVDYLTGNHDELLRRFTDFNLGTLRIDNKLVLPLNEREKAWLFHGDVFDVTMQYSKWLARLGAIGYDALILLNSGVNWLLTKCGREKMSFSRRIKAGIKNAVKFINTFELTAAQLAIEKGYDYVICGHIHQPEIRRIDTDMGTVTYLNSGDWVENLTALEYTDGRWQIFRYNPADFVKNVDGTDDLADNQLFRDMLDVRKLLNHLMAD